MALLLLACGGTVDPPAEERCDVQEPAAEGAPEPTFERVRETVFPSCGFSRCHPAVNPPGRAVISARDELAQRVYDDLVGAPASTDVEDRPPPDVPLRVAPGDPAASFLVWKIVGHDPEDPGRPVAGERMPLGCSGGGCLPCDRQQLVWRWIAAGARRN
jgi:hypothetical protein